MSKGESIGVAGNQNDLFGRLHYKVIRNGKSVRVDLLPGPRPALGGPRTYNLFLKENEREELIQYGLDKNSFVKSFSNQFSFQKIAYDQTKVLFIKHDGQATIKNGQELNTDQKLAILSLRMAPFPFHVKRKVPAEVYERWENPRVYKIWIDGEHIASSEMNKYHPSDFAHSSWVVLGEESRKRELHAFELYLQTEDYYNQRKQETKAWQRTWQQNTTKLFNQIGDI